MGFARNNSSIGPSEHELLDNAMLWLVLGVCNIVVLRARVNVRKYPSAVGSQDRPTSRPNLDRI